MKIIIINILLLLFSLLFTSCEDNNKQNISVSSSTSQIKFTLTSTKGEKITLEKYDLMILSDQLEGKIVLINFWAPWCAPCIKEIPNFVELQKKYKNNFIILGILFGKKTSNREVNNIIKKFNINFPILVGDENMNIAKAFNDVQMVPESYLYGKDAVFIKKYIGEIDKNDLESFLKKIQTNLYLL